MCWLWLFLAIVLEVTATVCLKLSDGFSRFLPTALMALFYGASFFPMAVALRRLDVGIAYAVWSAVGTALMTIVGVLVFKEAASLLKLSAIVMIMVGVVCLNVASRMPRAKGRDSGNTISARSDMALSRMARAVNVGGEGLLQVSPQSPQRAEPRWGPRPGRELGHPARIAAQAAFAGKTEVSAAPRYQSRPGRPGNTRFLDSRRSAARSE
jgi:small multidrug resistance pump